MKDPTASAATRMNLLRTRRRLVRVRKGVELLKRKREALVTELFRLARPAADERTRIAAQAKLAYAELVEALAVNGGAGLGALAWPERHVELTVESRLVWGVPVASLRDRPPIRRTLGARATAPGITGPAAASAALDFELLVDRLLDAAPRELLLQRLGEALLRTSRQLGTLERRLLPELTARANAIRGSLEEREREERLRLQHLLRRRRRA